MIGWADMVIVATNIIKDHMVQDFHVSEKKIKLIPRGVDLQKFSFSPKNLKIDGRRPEGQRPDGQQSAGHKPPSPVIGLVGRLTPIKGHRDFLTALSILKKRGISFKAEIIGETKNPKYKSDLLHYRDYLQMTNDVTFLGHLSNIPEHLKTLDLLVLPSTYPESFGRVIIEAQAVGVPVIATHVGGIREIIEHGKNGLLCPPHDPLALANNMEFILNHPKDTERMVFFARENVEEKYSKAEMVRQTEKVYQDLVFPKKILVIKLSSLGDIVLISPSLRALRQKFQDARITLLTSIHAKDIVEHCPYIDETIFVSNFFSTLRRLHKAKFDISIDFQNGHLTHWLCFLSRIQNRYGYERKGGWYLLNHPAKSKKLPPIAHQFNMLESILSNPANDKLEFWIMDDDRNAVDRLFQTLGIQKEKPSIGIHIGASWETKRWHLNHISKFCDKLASLDQQTILTGDIKDTSFEKEIISQAQKKIFSAVGKTTLRELGALIEKCSAFVSTDSLALHIAAAVGTPTIGLFGPTDAARHSPPSHHLLTLQQKVACGPCYRRTCDHHHQCMVNLDPSQVIQGLKTLSLLP